MKNKKMLVSIIRVLACVFVIAIITSLGINKNLILGKEKQTIKEMTQSENESNLQTQINNLNTTQQKYATDVQAYKKQIANAITNQGVSTSENDTGAVMAANIGKILSTRTTGTATAEDIAAGKTAWVNGTEITGTMTNSLELQTVRTEKWTGDRYSEQIFALNIENGTYYIFGMHAYNYNSLQYADMKIGRKTNNDWEYSGCEVISNEAGCPTVVRVDSGSIQIVVTGHDTNSDYKGNVYFTILKAV